MTITAAPPSTAASEPLPGHRSDRWSSTIRHLILATGVYVPLLLTARGRVVADTKSYLYLDPSRLLARAPYMWDPNIGLGTVTHQNIGYLFPMGPWFWVFQQLGVPDWVAQRLWLATIMFAAGAGVLYLTRSLGWRTEPDAVADGSAPETGAPWWLAQIGSRGALAAAALYMWSPFVLENASRFSVLLLPWAALPWLIGLTQRALRSGSWRHPALFAIVVTIVGGVNATALLLAGLGPLLWLPFAVWVHREATVRRALATAARIGALSLACSLWWIAGLSIQGGYGLDVLRYSETVQAVARTSLSSEVLRGLGYWFFYGGDKVGPWIEARPGYTEHLWLLAAGLAVPVLAIIAAVSTRWRYRAFFVAIVVIGTAVAVGAYPYGSPSPLGSLFKAFANSSSAGLAMRSTARAVPLVVLGLAILVAGGLAALARKLPRAAAVAAALVVLLAAIGLPPLWTGRFFGKNLQRAEDVPRYWKDAAAYLDRQGDATRVLEIPGSDFASYRWGTTIDPITPGLMDRPYAARELIPWGTAPSADLMNALDAQMQNGQLDPATIAPVARLMGVGDVVLRSDLEYERYRLPRPRALWAGLNPVPAGLGAPVAFGTPRPNLPIKRLSLQDAIELAIPAGTSDPPPVAVFPVKKPLPIVRAEATQRPIILAGDGEGVVQAAAAKLLGGQAPLFYAAALPGKDRKRLLASDAELVLTDSNRRRARRWSTVWENSGYTEPAGSQPLETDVSDNRLPLFPSASERAYTTVEQRGVREVTATAYGNPVTYIPEVRAANAFDGDTQTSWRVGDFSPVKGERLQVTLDRPVTADHVNLVQPLDGARNRYITKVGVRLDGRDIGTFALDASSRRPSGQSVDIGRHRFSRMELIVRGDNIGSLRRYDGISPVGFAEVRVPGVRVDEVVRLPANLLTATGKASADHDLVVLLQRQRSDPVDVGRRDEEESMVRAFSVPTSRRFSLSGDARISANVSEPVIDRLLGIPTVESGGITVRSSSYLRGILEMRGSSALDGDPSTAWTTNFGAPALIGAWLAVDMPRPITFDHLDLKVVADGHHSVPTRLRIEGGGAARTVDLPPVADRRTNGTAVPVTVRFDPLTASHVKVTVVRVRQVLNNDYYSEKPVARPIGLAELGIPGVQRAAPARQLVTRCRTDLLSMDGKPVGLRISGSVADAASRSALTVRVCGSGQQALELAPGDHLLRATKGKRSGIDLDRLELRSPGDASGAAPPRRASTPIVRVAHDGRTTLDVRVSRATQPFWLVLGESRSPGWTAKVEGGRSLGESALVDGYANGWYVDPRGQSNLRISVDWQPQRTVWVALLVSALAFLSCLVIAGWSWRRRPAQTLAAVSPDAAGPASPELSSPLSFGPGARRLRPVHRALVALACGLTAAVLVSPPVGALVLVVVGLALRRGRHSRAVLTGGAVAAIAITAAFVVARQAWRGGPPADFTWVTYFQAAHVLAWVALMFLAADVVIELATRRSPEQTPPPDREE